MQPPKPPLTVVFRHEMTQNLRLARFWIFALLVLALFVGSALNFGDYFNRYTGEYERSRSELRNAFSTLRKASDLRTITLTAMKELEVASVAIYGAEKSIPSVVRFNLIDRNIAMYHMFERNVLSALARHVDWHFIVAYCLSLAAMLLAHESFSGELEAGPLKLVLTNPISRGSVLAGKTLGITAVVSMLLLLGVSCALAVLAVLKVPIGPMDLMAFGCMAAVTVLLLGLLVVVATATSLWTGSRTVSLGLIVIFWLGMVSLLPSTSQLLASLYSDWPNRGELERRLQATRFVSDVEERYRMRSALNDEFQWDMMRQARLAGTLNSISPLHLYRRALHELSGTGLTRHEEFYRDAQAYIKALWRASYSGSLPNSVALLEPSQRKESFSERAQRGLITMAPQAVLGLLLFFVNFVKFSRLEIV